MRFVQVDGFHVPLVAAVLVLLEEADAAAEHLGEQQAQQGERLEGAEVELPALMQQEVEVVEMDVTGCSAQKHSGQLARLWKLQQCHSDFEKQR